MTTTAPVASEASVAAPPRRRRGVLAWIVIGVVLVGVGAIGGTIGNRTTQIHGSLDPDSPAPWGTRALVQVLRAQGVAVDVARDRTAATDALTDDSTLVVAATTVLSDAAVRKLADGAADVVLIDPSSRDVRVLLDSESGGLAPSATVAPRCGLAEAENAGPIVPGTLYAPSTGSDTTVHGCYPVDDAFGLLWSERGDSSRIVALDARDLFPNDRIAADGNAALAFGLLGRHPHLVWYLPSPQDSDLATAPTLGDLTPGWVTPVLVLLLCAGGVAAVWRGRRFGPLVTENLPVTVRAAETMEGRARLYARSRDAAHALDALRLGALDRIARLLGLGPASRAAEIADAAADRIGAQRAVVRSILIDAVPATDAELVAASDRLRDLETAVRAAVRADA